MVQPWLRERDMKAVEFSSFEDLFLAEQVPDFPYHKTSFEQAEWDPFCVLHTSGSTGLPKPVVVRQVRAPVPFPSQISSLIG
jgi:acyl-coenzyme A synthetase/AMP-(fatty) acid ligase